MVMMMMMMMDDNAGWSVRSGVISERLRKIFCAGISQQATLYYQKLYIRGGFAWLKQ